MDMCQGVSETGNVSHPSAHGTLTDLWNGHSRGQIPAECLEQKMLYVYATVTLDVGGVPGVGRRSQIPGRS